MRRARRRPSGPAARGLLAALLAVTTAGGAVAAERYVRPAGQGGGDGSSWTAAWSGLRSVDWAALGPGDTLRVCGTHAYTGDNALEVGAAGAPGLPLAITGECAGPSGPDPGAIFGVGVRFPPGLAPAGAWTGPDAYGVYRVEYASGCTGSFLLEEDGAPLGPRHPGRRLRWAEDDFADPLAARASWAPGTFWQAGCPGTLYLKPSAPGAPALPVAAAGGGTLVAIERRAHVAVRGLALYATHGRAVRLVDADHVTFEDNDLRWGLIGVQVSEDSDDGVLRGNRIADTIGSGVAFLTTRSASNAQSNDRWLVTGNRLAGISPACDGCGRATILATRGLAAGAPGKVSVPDRHAIGVQGGGNGLVIEYNDIRDVGGEAVLFYNVSALAGGNAQRDNVVRWNRIADVRDASPLCTAQAAPICSSESGVVMGSDGTPADPATITGNRVHGNVLVRVRGQAFRTKSTRAAAGHTWRFLNNTVVDSGTAFEFAVWNPATAPYRAGGAEFRNNLVWDAAPDATRPHVQALPSNGATAADTAGFALGANIYHPDGADPDGAGPLTGMFRWAGAIAAPSTDFAGWPALAGTPEPGSGTPDPGLPGAGDFAWAGAPSVIAGGGDYRPAPSPGSPAIDRGAASLGAPDILGNPVAGPPDIGAYEAPYADLSVTVTVAPPVVAAGGAVTYTTALGNHGPLAALDVRATGSLPPCATDLLLPDDTVSCSAVVVVTGLAAEPQAMVVAGADADLRLADNAAWAVATVDSDADGVPYAADNCRLAPNGPGDVAGAGTSQRDTNGDGFGNLCDGDVDDNGVVGSSDAALMRAAYGSGAWPDRDLDGNGTVNARDLAIFRLLYGQPPGPSGLAP